MYYNPIADIIIPMAIIALEGAAMGRRPISGGSFIWVYPRRRLSRRCMGRLSISPGALVGGLITGGLVAGGTALLFAPKAGNVTRRFVRWKSARYIRNARERFSRRRVAR
jgi:hypothetical protein